MKTPSAADWGVINYEDLDAEWAFKTFFGKSMHEADLMFQRNAFQYQEDLQSMPAIPFNFYVHALIRYITSPHAAGDSDGASSFLHLIASLLKSNPSIIYPETRTALLKTAFTVSQQQMYYEADISIYGSFTETYALIELLAGI